MLGDWANVLSYGQRGWVSKRRPYTRIITKGAGPYLKPSSRRVYIIFFSVRIETIRRPLDHSIETIKEGISSSPLMRAQSGTNTQKDRKLTITSG